MKILAAVVTHNRSKLLLRCTEYINNQTRRPDGIVVIDNGSTDNTANMLDKHNIRCIKQENLGSAGGWKRCIQVALDEGFDAIWLMDDDGFPDVKSLGKLEAHHGPDIAAISSTVLNEDNHDKFVFPFPVLGKDNLPVFLSFKRKIKKLSQLKKNVYNDMYPFAHFFNGALISCSAIKKVGNINDEYFIAGEEVDYFNRLSKFKVMTLLTAYHYHPDVSMREWSRLKFYYFIKNTIILNHKIFYFPYARDLATIVVSLFRVASRNGLLKFISYLIGKDCKVFYGAIYNGFLGKIGKDFNG